MSIVGESFLSSEQLSEKDIEQIFSRAALFKKEFQKTKRFDHLVSHNEALHQKMVAMVFSEPSTRTRMSFQMASARLGIRTMSLDNPQVSSLSKGETLEDTFRNIAAMLPDLMVVRYNTNLDADAVIRELPCPVINGGIGAYEHPTQALLDAFTIQEAHGKLKGEKMLIVGDVAHSRVANSNMVLLRRLGVEVAYCAPKEFEPTTEAWKGVRNFDSLNEGMEWASVVMGLRVQKERHASTGIGLSMAEYRERYRIGGDQLKHLRSDGILLHPGPVIRGIELSAFVLNDKRTKVLDQVTNGVFVRASLMSIMLGLEVQQK
ncbi:MAG: aspartate carbamoyltransferase catalytic subunit [Bdellovibrionales bacterium]|nr:aspartate carbamoyltransferase catalytic subunit [Bdellovibrionales bacterium]